jgi:S-DNA-T family DNA segregation ATPase FtsK/SpoIIIE
MLSQPQRQGDVWDALIDGVESAVRGVSRGRRRARARKRARWSGPPASMWDPIPFMVDRSGRVVHLRLFEHNLLGGGLQGYGKSSAMRPMLVTAGLLPDVQVFAMNFKAGLDWGPWLPTMAGYAEDSLEDALAVARQVEKIVEGRKRKLAYLARREQRTYSKISLDTPGVLLLIDEVHWYTNSTGRSKEDKALVEQINGSLFRSLSLGRALGVVIVAMSQKPAGEVIPTEFRDLFDLRWCCRTGSSSHTGVILARQDVPASDLAAPGDCFFKGESGGVVQGRVCYVSDGEMDRFAARAREIRGVSW